MREVPCRYGAPFEHLEKSNGRAKTVEVVDVKVKGQLTRVSWWHYLLLGGPEAEWVPGELARLGAFFLAAEDVEHDGGAERVADHMNLAFEAGITLHEELVDAVGLLQDDPTDLFPVGTLVEED